MLDVCQQVAAIPMKRSAPAETHFLERDEVLALLRHLPRTGRFALRDPPCSCSCSSTTPAVGCRKSPTYESDISNSERPPWSVCTARRQVADLPAIAPDRTAADPADRGVQRTTEDGHTGVLFRARRGPDTLRHLQDRAAPRWAP